ncbi:hypothetical protein ZOSMA_456G00030 [Zostera marina]|uniref:Exostosin GT47 domain-containing protein n=1 Tax=Zostera marina TaxID=29655 RepID=A0A0K9P0P0_ZOSMR|nr:hypothetical protein ZOSMA_456G00030 [Zostera marina]
MTISCLSLIQLLSDLHFFQGAIQRKEVRFIRRNLFKILKHEKDVHFSFGSVRSMHSSKFCLNISGDTSSSNRLLDAIASHCVPYEDVLDEIELPYEDVLDYLEFCVLIRPHIRFSQKGFLGPFGCSVLIFGLILNPYEKFNFCENNPLTLIKLHL